MKETPLQTRQDLEASEQQRLAPFAVTCASSRGRTHDEAEHPLRTAFQRDRDRIIHSSAFRRLEAKTQVFVDRQEDYFRTRLTHTLEVAQIARTMARALAVNEDLAETVALAHDLGHPPYGHSGEAVLHRLMGGHGGFEHNAQSLRVVEYLEHPYPAFRGLNLSYETLECMAKHESRYDQPGLQDRFGRGQAPIEGQIADLADAIAYNSHDLDDALVSHIIKESDLQDIELYRKLRDEFQQRYPRTHEIARQIRCAKGLIDLLVTDALEEGTRRLQSHQPKSLDSVRAAPDKFICLSASVREGLDQLADFLMERVYHHPDVVASQKKAQGQIERLFDHFLREPGALPDRYRQRLDELGVHRVICDYIAGMTDRYCREHYEKYEKYEKMKYEV